MSTSTGRASDPELPECMFGSRTCARDSALARAVDRMVVMVLQCFIAVVAPQSRLARGDLGDPVEDAVARSTRATRPARPMPHNTALQPARPPTRVAPRRQHTPTPRTGQPVSEHQTFDDDRIGIYHQLGIYHQHWVHSKHQVTTLLLAKTWVGRRAFPGHGHALDAQRAWCLVREPVPPEAELVGHAGEPARRGKGIRGALVATDRHEVENGDGGGLVAHLECSGDAGGAIPRRAADYPIRGCLTNSRESDESARHVDRMSAEMGALLVR